MAAADTAEPKLNILLISLDTTRADRLGPYGFAGGATPNIDALAAGGVVFEQCATVAPLTVPAHASLMTGTYPFRHGVRDNGRFVLSPESHTLAEALSGAGWATGAQVGVFVLNRGTGIEQGFATYRDTSDVQPAASASPAVPLSRRETNELAADAVADGALAWLRDHADEPFFLFAHFFDPHAPYEPPEPFRSQLAGADRTPELDRYLGEIAWVDFQIGRLLEGMRELGLEDETLVVLTADHGEAFGEHREIGHSYFIYDTTVHVPLIVRLPGQLEAGLRVPTQVRLIDVAPTILDLVGEPPLPEAQGVSLAPYLRGEARDLGLVAYAETLAPFLDYRYSPLAALRTEEWKYIDAPREELYQLSYDPGERENVLAAHPELAQRMGERLERLVGSALPDTGPGDALDPGRRARLESLGYLGGTGDDSGRLPPGHGRRRPQGQDRRDDPGLDGFAGLSRSRLRSSGSALRGTGRTRSGEQLLPRQVGRDAACCGRLDGAAKLYQDRPRRRSRLARRPPGPGAHRHRSRGDLATASGHLSELAHLDPDDLRTQLDYGNVAAIRGDLSAAGDAFRRALEIAPDNTEALVLLARIDLLAQRYEAAAAGLEEALSDPAAPDEARLQLAWLRATNPASGLRDGARALELARTRPATSVVSKLVLAAALAESRDFEAAADEALAAAALPPAGARDAHWAPRAAALAATFRQGEPHRTREPL